MSRKAQFSPRINIAQMSPSEIRALCQQDLPSSLNDFHYFMNMSKAHNLKLLMYEGGPSLESSQNNAATDSAVAFNRHDLVEVATADVLKAWYDVVGSDPYNTYPGGLFNYFASVGTYSKYGSWGMMEYTGQDPHTSPKYRAVHKYINSHFNNHYMGPSCSFVQVGNVVYGCYKQSNNQLRCGSSPDHGAHWTNYPVVPTNTTSSALILDGYDVNTHVMYVRSVDDIAANSYFSISTSAQPSQWKSLAFDEYFRLSSPASVKRRMPNGVHNGVNVSNFMCM